MTKEIDQLGNTTLYKYDQMFNLKKVILPNNIEKGIGTSDEERDDGAGYVYEYDCMNRLVQVTDPRHNILRKYIHDLKGNVIKEILSYGCRQGKADEEKVGITYKYNYMNWLV